VKSLLFLSPCPEAWGGSEDLWSGAAGRLAQAGHTVAAYKTVVEQGSPEIRQLAQSGVRVFDARPAHRSELVRAAFRVSPRAALRWSNRSFERDVDELRPDLVLVSQSENFDGLHFAEFCRRRGLRYALLAQKASDAVWPADHVRRTMRVVYRDALRCFFVSRHNQTLTEAQLGETLPHAEVVWNPWRVQAAEPLPWPEVTAGLRLACVGRLWVPDKGQDMLLRVLARPAWRTRALRVSFFGKGEHGHALEGMARYLGLENVRFCGFTRDVAAIWRDHHALVLPSRAEGRPLTMIEAMWCGRPSIAAATAGGIAEMIEDGETGFLAGSASEDQLADAMERAWQRRDDWQAVGAQAFRRVRALAPADPVGELVDRLLALC
jgi:glycosyltransferase involved in cell wall biosynthesis